MMMMAFLSALPIRCYRRQLFPKSSLHRFCRINPTPRPASPHTQPRQIRHVLTRTVPAMSATEATPSPLSSVSTDGCPSVAGPFPIYAQCMLRINDPAASHNFYSERLGMKKLTRFDFPKFKFSLFFYAYTDATPPPQESPQPERAEWLWARPEPTIELTWNWVADTFEESMSKVCEIAAPEEVYVNGNADGQPKGFGYVEVSVSNLADALSSFDSSSIIRPASEVNDAPDLVDALVQDPDGYHVRLIGNADSSGSGSGSVGKLDAVFSSIMIRVKDPTKAIPFFARLGFKTVASTDLPNERATEWYMGVSSKRGDASWARSKLRASTVTLRYEWGTEANEEQIYTNGNVKPYRGFGHVGVIVDDIYELAGKMEELGYKIVRKPSPFADVGDIAFVAEPSTDYWVELINRSGERPEVDYEQAVLG